MSGRNIFEVLRRIDQLDAQRLAAYLPDPFRLFPSRWPTNRTSAA
jgi:hypothetical protein